MDSSNLDFTEEIYAKYLADQASVDPSWQAYFEGLDQPVSQEKSSDNEIRIRDLIAAYRSYGHLIAKINPLSTENPREPDVLQLGNLGFSDADLNKAYPTCGILSKKEASLKEIIDALRFFYSGSFGVEYMDLQNPEIKRWIQGRIEGDRSKFELPIEEKKMILEQLNKSELFEVFLHTKYVGQKRFSLEGAETLIPMLETILASGSQLGMEEFIIGMAHRGRLNVMSNILNKSYTQIFSEFDEGYVPDFFEGTGDVKYHKGFISDVTTRGSKKIKVSLTANPSHLESVGAVVEGQTKARQIQSKDDQQIRVVPILIHGDAALSGQGVVYETLQMHKLRGYNTGGTLHFVVNNQIGFTTLPLDARSTLYCTDIARTFNAPTFHVNAEDPEACIFVTHLAVELRQKFKCDVFVDLICYRKYGHNESDEPAYTQPIEYGIIRKKKPIREIYRDELISQGVMEKKLVDSLEAEFKAGLQEALQGMKIGSLNEDEKKDKRNLEKMMAPVETGVARETLLTIAEKISVVPEGFNIHPKVKLLVNDRLKAVKDGQKLDWGMAELLAYGSLLWNGESIRLSGQDTCRGTFSHRHGLWMDQVEEKEYFPLKNLKPGQGRFDLINSHLSEFAALGFEYGYSIAYPESLVIWEAQFGDFSNGGQIIIDQYIASGEQKWGQKSDLTLLLPHGYEGQGPEHSSGRMERYLSLCGNCNMFVANPTTPAQLFHLLRRQLIGGQRKPLIVFTPKGLLRHPQCVSTLDDLTHGTFQTVIKDDSVDAEKLVFCSGRIYYDLLAIKEKDNRDDVALVRVEQLYPFDEKQVEQVIKDYPQAKHTYWVQEEPRNMGAWDYIHPHLQKLLKTEIKYIGRPRSASPAVGSYVLHKNESKAIFEALYESRD